MGGSALNPVPEIGGAVCNPGPLSACSTAWFIARNHFAWSHREKTQTVKLRAGWGNWGWLFSNIRMYFILIKSKIWLSCYLFGWRGSQQREAFFRWGQLQPVPARHKNTTAHFITATVTHSFEREYDLTGSLTGQRSRQTLAPPTALPTGRHDE